MQEGPGSFIESYIFWVFSCHDLLVVLLATKFYVLSQNLKMEAHIPLPSPFFLSSLVIFVHKQIHPQVDIYV